MESDVSQPAAAGLLAYVHATGIFRDCSAAALQATLPELVWLALPEGATLFRQGDVGDALYIVIAGSLQAAVEQEDGSELFVREIGAGELIGEMQLLAGGKRTASIYVQRQAQLIKLPQEVFQRLAEQNPQVMQRLAALIRRRLRRNQLATILPTMIGALDEATLRDIETEVTWVQLPRGQILFRQGDIGDSFYIVVGGRLRAATVVDGHEQVVGDIAPGEIVGEMAVFTGEERSASISAIRDSELVQFSKAAFERLLEKHPQFTTRIIEFLVRRLRQIIQSPPVSRPHTVLNITLVPASPSVPLADLATRLAAALSSIGPTLHLNSARLERFLGVPGAAQA